MVWGRDGFGARGAAVLGLFPIVLFLLQSQEGQMEAVQTQSGERVSVWGAPC